VPDRTDNRSQSSADRNPLSTIRDWTGVVLVGLLIFSILLAIAGFVASYDGRRKLAAFESDGRTAIGTITSRYVRSGEQAYWTRTFHGDDQAYWVSLCFSMQDKRDHCGAISLPGRTFDSLRVGSPLKVTYVPWNPDWFYVGDEVPADRDSDAFTRMFKLCTIAALLLIIVLAAMVFWQHEDGTAGHTDAYQANGIASHFRQRHGYGRRRRPG